MKTAVQFSNPFVLIFLIGTVVSLLINHFLEFVDYKARCKNGGRLPEEIKAVPEAAELFDTEKLSKICQYENAKYFQYIHSSVCTMVLELLLVIFGFYPFIFESVCNWLGGMPQTVGKSFICFLLFMILSSIPASIISIPFDLYREFHTEKKFGFSNMTIKLWITDQIKSLALSLLLALNQSHWFNLCHKN